MVLLGGHEREFLTRQLTFSTQHNFCLKALATPELAAMFLGTVSFMSNAFFNELLNLCNTLGWSKLPPRLKTMFMKFTSNIMLCVEL